MMEDAPHKGKIMRAQWSSRSAIPLEAFAAIDRKPEALIALLRSNVPLTNETREALALWLEDELPPKRAAHRPKAKRLYGEIPDAVWMEFAADQYKRIARWLSARGKMRGESDKLYASIAKKKGVTEAGLRNAVRVGGPRVPEITTDLREIYLLWRDEHIQNK